MEMIDQRLPQTIQAEIEWIEKIVDTSLTLYFKNESEIASVLDHTPPDLTMESSYGKFVLTHELDSQERIVLMLALLPHVKPQIFDVFQIKNQNLDTHFSEFGGYRNDTQLGFLPTLTTACFILGGYELDVRFDFIQRFNQNHLLFKLGVLDLDPDLDYGLNQKLKISMEYLGLFTTGEKHLPQFGSKFPAKEISTALEWEDLIVDEDVRKDLDEIKDWLMHSDLILNDWELSKNIKPGLRVLFYGTPGTGKTMAATLLGKSTNRPVFRVDLSLVVSKYIGETEKNLGQLFDEAEHKDWILFFDEADALFGKRTQTRGSNDRYANQEVAYLLQRIEDFSGLVVLATNIQTNIDEAFSRRFQSMVHFPKPDKTQRKALWQRLFGNKLSLENNINMNRIADDYELSGGEMINILRYCALEAAKRDDKIVKEKDIIIGIRREYSKSNKTI